jgi:hypothetical protein
VVIKKSSVTKYLVELRDASLPELGNRGTEFSWELQNNGKKGTRLWKEVFMYDMR